MTQGERAEIEAALATLRTPRLGNEKEHEHAFHVLRRGMPRALDALDAAQRELDGIMRDFGIESDESVREIIERTTAAAVKYRDELRAIGAPRAPR